MIDVLNTGIKQLETAIKLHQKAYDAGEPTISDVEFDELIAKLRDLKPDSKVLEELGNTLTSRKVRHDVPMLSLEKEYEVSRIVAWAQKIGGKFVVAPKYDGASLSLVYEQGQLAHALTRGKRGQQGDDVTHSAVYVEGVPLEINTNLRTIVRGEVLFTLQDWEADLKAHFEAKKKPGSISNPRNAVAGTLLSKKPEKKVLRRSYFLAYDILTADNNGDYDTSAASLVDRLDDLRAYDFEVGRFIEATPETLEEVIDDLRAHEFPMETDGLVIKVDSYARRKLLGATAHHPRWAIALKYQGGNGETTLKDVTWQVSRTGAVSPVGIVEPIELSGATITRVTLHNLDQIKKLGLKVPAVVSITRRGGIIPHIESVVRAGSVDGYVKNVKPPARCPSCDEPTHRRGGFVHCLNFNHCEDQIVGRVVYWCREVGMLGWGEEVVRSLHSAGVLESVADIYTIDKGEAASVLGKGLGPKLLRERDAHKIMTPAVFLSAIGIPGIGLSQAQKILAAVSVPDLLRDAVLCEDPEDAEYATPPAGFSLQRWTEVRSYVNDHEEEIERLFSLVTLQKADVRDGTLRGLKFVFTGKLADMEREDAQEAVRALGAMTPSGVTKDLNFLVVGSLARDEQVSKREKAEKYNAAGAKIKVLTELEFMELLVQAQNAEE